VEITSEEKDKEEDEDASNNAPFDSIGRWACPPPICAQIVCLAVTTPAISSNDYIEG
jgi:hypothetical protein